MDRQEALAILLGAPGVDKLIQYFGSPEGAAQSLNVIPPSKAFDFVHKNGIQLLHRLDRRFPKQLLRRKAAPSILSIQGTLLEKDEKAIAIIGTRTSSPEGVSKAYQLAHDFACRGYTVISGLARGIDTAAHWGALQAGGRTIAVIGSGLGRIYPEENKSLAEAIAKQGAIISEYPIFAEPQRHHFPQRNRIISGLSMAMLMVEAPKKSGAIQAMEGAEKQKVPRFVLPGRPNTITTEGNLYLLGMHRATLVENAQELIDALNNHVPQQLTLPTLGYEQIGVN